MKKLILMTSALTLIGGAAIAQDISVGGTASLTYGNWGTGDGGMAGFDFETEVVLGLEGSSGDFTYGAELTLENGEERCARCYLDRNWLWQIFVRRRRI